MVSDGSSQTLTVYLEREEEELCHCEINVQRLSVCTKSNLTYNLLISLTG